ncbi:MAG: hypothetical protein WCA38_01530 [Candidatus Acidiferrales bacterium]
MQYSDEPQNISQKFDWEKRFYQCLSLRHVELAERVSQAEEILSERTSQTGSAILAPEREALDDALQHLRQIQVQQLGYPATNAELLKKQSSLPEHGEIEQESDLTGRPIPPSERPRLWKTHKA